MASILRRPSPSLPAPTPAYGERASHWSRFTPWTAALRLFPRTVAVTPFKMGAFEFDEVKRVCQDCTFAGFKAVMAALPQKPFRFLYFSAEGTPREADAQITTWREYQLMRVSYRILFQIFLSTRFCRLTIFPGRNGAHGSCFASPVPRSRSLHRTARCRYWFRDLGQTCAGLSLCDCECFYKKHSQHQ